jgi:hypothetical protein
MKGLFKATYVVWAEPEGKLKDENPFEKHEFETIAYEATRGVMYRAVNKAEWVPDPEKDPDWDGTDFFNDPEEDVCPQADGQRHKPDFKTLQIQYDGDEAYIDVNCEHCGRSGCLAVVPRDEEICW